MFEGERQRYAHMPQKGQDFEYNLSITLEESVFGADKKLALQKADGIEEINFKVPPGISTGKKLRLRQGRALPGQTEVLQVIYIYISASSPIQFLPATETIYI